MRDELVYVCFGDQMMEIGLDGYMDSFCLVDVCVVREDVVYVCSESQTLGTGLKGRLHRYFSLLMLLGADTKYFASLW